VLLIAFVYIVGILVLWRFYIALDVPTWYATPEAGRLRPQLAGWWYFFVSLPLFQFILLRWYFRLFIWTRFLWQISRLPLAYAPMHPDRMGGIGFLSRIAQHSRHSLWRRVRYSPGRSLTGSCSTGPN
jgi:hypothetical protein